MAEPTPQSVAAKFWLDGTKRRLNVHLYLQLDVNMLLTSMLRCRTAARHARSATFRPHTCQLEYWHAYEERAVGCLVGLGYSALSRALTAESAVQSRANVFPRPRHPRLKTCAAGKLAHGAQGKFQPGKRCRTARRGMAQPLNVAASGGMPGEGGEAAPTWEPRMNGLPAGVQRALCAAVGGPLGVPMEWMAAKGAGLP